MGTVFWLQQEYKPLEDPHSVLTILIVVKLQKQFFYNQQDKETL
jgi:hypothetical protein